MVSASLPCVSPARAANLRIARQFSVFQSAPEMDTNTAISILEHLGQIQMDPMSVVGRSEHLTLWSRLPSYQTGDLGALRTGPPHVFEYWTRAACLLPLSLYPLMRPAMNRRRTDHWWPKWVNWWLGTFPDVHERMIKKVETDGPVTVSDFPREKGKKEWGDWKVTKQGLEALWTIGELMVCQRRGSEKLFDLPERILPPDVLRTQMDDRERIRQLLKLALRSAGVYRAAEFANYYGPMAWPSEAKLGVKDLADMADEGWLSLITLSGRKGQWVCLTEDLPSLLDGSDIPIPSRMTFLCPFDNLLWDRKSLDELFGFQYSFEAYLPEAKRKYGCYTMPVLWGSRLVGRLAPKLDRDNERLVVNGIWIEPGADLGKEFLDELAGTLHQFSGFLKAKTVDIVATHPAVLKARLSKLI